MGGIKFTNEWNPRKKEKKNILACIRFAINVLLLLICFVFEFEFYISNQPNSSSHKFENSVTIYRILLCGCIYMLSKCEMKCGKKCVQQANEYLCVHLMSEQEFKNHYHHYYYYVDEMWNKARQSNKRKTTKREKKNQKNGWIWQWANFFFSSSLRDKFSEILKC